MGAGQQLDRLIRDAKHCRSTSTHRRNKNHFVSVGQSMLDADIILIDRIQKTNARHIELGIILLQLAPKFTDCAALRDFF